MEQVNVNLQNLAIDGDIPEAQAKALAHDLKWREQFLSEIEPSDLDDELSDEAQALLEGLNDGI